MVGVQFSSMLGFRLHNLQSVQPWLDTCGMDPVTAVQCSGVAKKMKIIRNIIITKMDMYLIRLKVGFDTFKPSKQTNKLSCGPNGHFPHTMMKKHFTYKQTGEAPSYFC